MARGRKRLIAGWSLITLGFSLMWLMVASCWLRARVSPVKPWTVSIASGSLHVSRDPDRWYPGWPARPYVGLANPPELYWIRPPLGEPFEVMFTLGVLRVERQESPWRQTEWFGEVMLWPLALVSFGMAFGVRGWSKRASRRARMREGLCPACLYDLKGLEAGAACPECGKGRRG